MQTLGLKTVPEPKGYQIFGFDFEKSVDGYDALIQRFIKFFLTPIGSDPLDLEYGTTFARDAFTTIDALSVEASVVQSVDYTVEKLSEMDVGREPENALSTANVLQVTVEPGGSVTIKLELVNKAGTSYLVGLAVGA